MEGRITTQFERVLTTTVDNIEHIESTTVNGQAMVKIFLQPNASLDTANAQVTAVAQTILRQLPPGITPPLIINYSASSVPILQLALSGMSEAELNDIGLNFLRTQLVTVPGVAIPYPYGGKQRQIMVDLDQKLPGGHRHRPRRPKRRGAGWHREDRGVRVRRHDERRSPHRGRPERAAGQGRQQLADLSARRRLGQ